MNRYLLVTGIILVLLVTGLSGCFSTPVSEGDVEFIIDEVLITSELEREYYYSNETKIEISNDTSYVIVSISVRNGEDKWLSVMTAMDSLTDDEGNTYDGEMFVKINGSTYGIDMLVLITEEEALGWSSDVSPCSTQIKKAFFDIPLGKIPKTINIAYGFKDNELSNVERWYHITLDL